MSRYPYKLIDMVKTINEVGFTRLRKYTKQNHPKENFYFNLEVARWAGRYGYAACCTRFNISRQRANKIMKTLYEHATQIKNEEEKQ